MIKVIQRDSLDCSSLLYEMFKTRTKIFKEKKGWDIELDEAGLDIDNYDVANTIYIIKLNESGVVTGTWRFLLNTEPSMIKDLWPQYTASLPVPVDCNMCETSRFGVHVDTLDKAERNRAVNTITSELIIALNQVCILCGITDMFTLYGVALKRLMKRIGFNPIAVSDVIPLEGKATLTARFRMDEAMLAQLRATTNIDLSIKPEDLPPLLYERYQRLHLQPA